MCVCVYIYIYIYIYIYEILFDITAVSQTWLESDDCSIISLPGCKVIHRNRKVRKVEVEESISFSVIDTMSVVIYDV